MTTPEKLGTTISSKGQVVLPQAIRRKQRWTAGTKLTVEETPDGVLLRSAPLFPSTRLDDVFGCAGYDGPPISLDTMDAAVEAEIKARHARGRY